MIKFPKEKDVPKKVLIVEDRQEYAEVIKDLLESEKIKVAIALTGEEALKKAVSMGPDLILLDLILPGIDGFEVCRRIRSNPAFNGTKIVVLSGVEDSAKIERTLNEGAAEYVLKTASAETIIERIKENLECE